MTTAGYSGTPLEKKLGIRAGFIMRVVNPPAGYHRLFTQLPPDVRYSDDTQEKKDLVHYFARSAAPLTSDLYDLKNEIKQNGALWISWPKKASRVATDLSEDLIRRLALDQGLVDIKVCAVDEIWSALKLVIPVSHRR